MSSFNGNAPRVFERARAMLAVACVVTLAGLLVAQAAEARGWDFSGSARVYGVQMRGRDFSDERGAGRANERAIRQGGRGQRQPQMESPRGGQRSEQMQRAPERELAVPQAPGFRPPDPDEAGRMGRPGRLTPDERRALRQQINQAGRDVYRPSGRP